MSALQPVPAVPAVSLLNEAIQRIGLALNHTNMMPRHVAASLEDAFATLKLLRAAQEATP